MSNIQDFNPPPSYTPKPKGFWTRNKILIGVALLVVIIVVWVSCARS